MARREVLEIPGLSHGSNPIPVAVKIGPLLVTGTISGTDPETKTAPPDAKAQIAMAFSNVRRVLERGGAGPENVAKVDVALRDLAHREIVNREWVKMFPDVHDRPVRHTSKSELPGNLLIQMEITAVLG